MQGMEDSNFADKNDDQQDLPVIDDTKLTKPSKTSSSGYELNTDFQHLINSNVVVDTERDPTATEKSSFIEEDLDDEVNFKFSLIFLMKKVNIF